MLLLLSGAKLACEIALLALLGQAVLHVVAGARRDTNIFYQLLRLVARPFTVLARAITPRLVLEKHVPLVAFSLLLVLWVVLTIEKVRHCAAIGMAACR